MSDKHKIHEYLLRSRKKHIEIYFLKQTVLNMHNENGSFFDTYIHMHQKLIVIQWA